MNIGKYLCAAGLAILLVGCEGSEATEAISETGHMYLETQTMLEEINFRAGLIQEKALEAGLRDAANDVQASAAEQMSESGFSQALVVPPIADMPAWCYRGECSIAVRRSVSISGLPVSPAGEVDYDVTITALAVTTDAAPQATQRAPLQSSDRYLLRTYAKPPFASLERVPYGWSSSRSAPDT